MGQRNPAPVENGGLSHDLQGFKHPFGGAGFPPSTGSYSNIPGFPFMRPTKYVFSFPEINLNRETSSGHYGHVIIHWQILEFMNIWWWF